MDWRFETTDKLYSLFYVVLEKLISGVTASPIMFEPPPFWDYLNFKIKLKSEQQNVLK